MADDHLPDLLRRSTLVLREVRCACTREHLALASHNHLCQTYFRKKATHEKRPAGGEGNTMDLGTGIALLVAFLAVVVLIIRGQSPFIMLLLLAVIWAVIAGIGIDVFHKKLIQAGGVLFVSEVKIISLCAWLVLCHIKIW